MVKMSFDQNPHSNIFYACKSPRGRKQNDIEEGLVKGQQIENNITRALIVLLAHLYRNRNSRLVKKFVNQMCNDSNSGLKGPFDFDIFKSHKGLDNSLKKMFQRKVTIIKLLLIIRPSWQEELELEDFNKTYPKKNTMPDAWVTGSNFILAIESKTNDRIRPYQIKGHIKHQLQAYPDFKKVVRQKTWRDIYDFFKKQHLTEAEDKFIVKQFYTYLQNCGLGPFPGFDANDFNFLGIKEKESQKQFDYARWVLIDKLWALGEDVLEKSEYKEFSDPSKGLKWKRKQIIHEADVHFICKKVPLKISKIKDSKEREKKEADFISSERAKKAHLWVMLDKNRLYVFAHIGNKDGGESMKKLAKLIEKDDYNLLRILHKDQMLNDYEIELYRYNPKTKNGYPTCLPNELSNLSVDKINQDSLIRIGKAIKENIPKYQSLEFTLTKTFEKSEITKEEADGQVKKIAEAMKALHPFIKFVNYAN